MPAWYANQSQQFLQTTNLSLCHLEGEEQPRKENQQTQHLKSSKANRPEGLVHIVGQSIAERTDERGIVRGGLYRTEE